LTRNWRKISQREKTSNGQRPFPPAIQNSPVSAGHGPFKSVWLDFEANAERKNMHKILEAFGMMFLALLCGLVVSVICERLTERL
jgi:hypothetical protein